MSEPSAIMIFAAGFGTRMGALTQDRPKPLIHVAGRPLLDHALGFAAPLNLPITVNAHYHADQIVKHLAGRDITVLHEAPDILDTGGGLKNANFQGAAFTLNPDAIWQGPNPLRALRDAWDGARMEALLMLIPTAQTVGYDRGGNFAMAADGRLTYDQTGLVYAGAQIIKTARVNDHPDDVFSLRQILLDMAHDGTLFGISYPGQWADVGTPAGIPLAEGLLDV